MSSSPLYDITPPVMQDIKDPFLRPDSSSLSLLLPSQRHNSRSPFAMEEKGEQELSALRRTQKEKVTKENEVHEGTPKQETLKEVRKDAVSCAIRWNTEKQKVSRLSSSSSCHGISAPPDVSPWVFRKRYVKPNCVGVTIYILYRMPRVLMHCLPPEMESSTGSLFPLFSPSLRPCLLGCRGAPSSLQDEAHGEGVTSSCCDFSISDNDDSRSRNGSEEGLTCITDTGMRIIKVLFMALQHAIQALGGKVAQHYKNTSVTHILLLDVAKVYESQPFVPKPAPLPREAATGVKEEEMAENTSRLVQGAKKKPTQGRNDPNPGSSLGKEKGTDAVMISEKPRKRKRSLNETEEEEKERAVHLTSASTVYWPTKDCQAIRRDLSRWSSSVLLSPVSPSSYFLSFPLSSSADHTIPEEKNEKEEENENVESATRRGQDQETIQREMKKTTTSEDLLAVDDRSADPSSCFSSFTTLVHPSVLDGADTRGRCMEFDERQKEQHALSLVTSQWLEDSVGWGFFVSEAAHPSYGWTMSPHPSPCARNGEVRWGVTSKRKRPRGREEANVEAEEREEEWWSRRQPSNHRPFSPSGPPCTLVSSPPPSSPLSDGVDGGAAPGGVASSRFQAVPAPSTPEMPRSCHGSRSPPRHPTTMDASSTEWSGCGTPHSSERVRRVDPLQREEPACKRPTLPPALLPQVIAHSWTPEEEETRVSQRMAHQRSLSVRCASVARFLRDCTTSREVETKDLSFTSSVMRPSSASPCRDVEESSGSCEVNQKKSTPSPTAIEKRLQAPPHEGQQEGTVMREEKEAQWYHATTGAECKKEASEKEQEKEIKSPSPTHHWKEEREQDDRKKSASLVSFLFPKEEMRRTERDEQTAVSRRRGSLDEQGNAEDESVAYAPPSVGALPMTRSYTYVAASSSRSRREGEDSEDTPKNIQEHQIATRMDRGEDVEERRKESLSPPPVSPYGGTTSPAFTPQEAYHRCHPQTVPSENAPPHFEPRLLKMEDGDPTTSIMVPSTPLPQGREAKPRNTNDSPLSPCGSSPTPSLVGRMPARTVSPPPLQLVQRWTSLSRSPPAYPTSSHAIFCELPISTSQDNTHPAVTAVRDMGRPTSDATRREGPPPTHPKEEERAYKEKGKVQSTSRNGAARGTAGMTMEKCGMNQTTPFPVLVAKDVPGGPSPAVALHSPMLRCYVLHDVPHGVEVLQSLRRMLSPVFCLEPRKEREPYRTTMARRFANEEHRSASFVPKFQNVIDPSYPLLQLNCEKDMKGKGGVPPAPTDPPSETGVRECHRIPAETSTKAAKQMLIPITRSSPPRGVLGASVFSSPLLPLFIPPALLFVDNPIQADIVVTREVHPLRSSLLAATAYGAWLVKPAFLYAVWEEVKQQLPFKNGNGLTAPWEKESPTYWDSEKQGMGTSCNGGEDFPRAVPLCSMQRLAFFRDWHDWSGTLAGTADGAPLVWPCTAKEEKRMQTGRAKKWKTTETGEKGKQAGEGTPHMANNSPPIPPFDASPATVWSLRPSPGKGKASRCWSPAVVPPPMESIKMLSQAQLYREKRLTLGQNGPFSNSIFIIFQWCHRKRAAKPVFSGSVVSLLPTLPMQESVLQAAHTLQKDMEEAKAGGEGGGKEEIERVSSRLQGPCGDEVFNPVSGKGNGTTLSSSTVPPTASSPRPVPYFSSADNEEEEEEDDWCQVRGMEQVIRGGDGILYAVVLVYSPEGTGEHAVSEKEESKKENEIEKKAAINNRETAAVQGETEWYFRVLTRTRREDPSHSQRGTPRGESDNRMADDTSFQFSTSPVAPSLLCDSSSSSHYVFSSSDLLHFIDADEGTSRDGPALSPCRSSTTSLFAATGTRSPQMYGDEKKGRPPLSTLAVWTLARYLMGMAIRDEIEDLTRNRKEEKTQEDQSREEKSRLDTKGTQLPMEQRHVLALLDDRLLCHAPVTSGEVLPPAGSPSLSERSLAVFFQRLSSSTPINCNNASAKDPDLLLCKETPAVQEKQVERRKKKNINPPIDTKGKEGISQSKSPWSSPSLSVRKRARSSTPILIRIQEKESSIYGLHHVMRTLFAIFCSSSSPSCFRREQGDAVFYDFLKALAGKPFPFSPSSSLLDNHEKEKSLQCERSFSWSRASDASGDAYWPYSTTDDFTTTTTLLSKEEDWASSTWVTSSRGKKGWRVPNVTAVLASVNARMGSTAAWKGSASDKRRSDADEGPLFWTREHQIPIWPAFSSPECPLEFGVPNPDLHEAVEWNFRVSVGSTKWLAEKLFTDGEEEAKEMKRTEREVQPERRFENVLSSECLRFIAYL